jgi:hypothetical protein
MAGRQQDEPPLFEVVACTAGRCFKVRREDMKKLLLATRGKVFTLQNMPQLIDCTRLKEYTSFRRGPAEAVGNRRDSRNAWVDRSG